MNAGGRPRGGALVGKLLLMAMSLLVTLGAVEVALRLVAPSPPRTMSGPQLEGLRLHRKDAELGWVPRPNASGAHDEQGLFTSTFRTNARGIRGPEHALAKPVGTTRIVAIGDSFTWGYGVSNGEPYPDRLQVLLPGTEVINLGVTAYDLKQEIRYLAREGVQYAPDVVVLGLCLNDIPRPIGARAIPGEAPAAPAAAPPAAPAPSGFLGLKRALADHSQLYRFVIDRVNGNRNLARLLVRLGIKGELKGFDELDTNLMPALRTYPPAMAAAWDSTQAELLQLQALTRARGLRLVVALIPSVQSVDEATLTAALSYSVYGPADFDLDKPYRLLEAFGRAHGIEVVNPVARFRAAAAGGARLYHRNEMHFNAAGHALFAEAIAERLR